jgi:predicted transposase YdaD
LDELGEVETLPTGLGLMVLTTLEGEKAKNEARSMIERSGSDRAIIDIVSTIIVYRFGNLSRDEVNAMLGIELEQTRVYQEAKAEGEAKGRLEGKAEEGRSLVIKQLNRKLGNLSPQLQTQINSLSIDRVESLSEALLDFTSIGDLEAWFSNN